MSVISQIAGGINLAGSITNALTDASVKQFYNLRDFYNFIRKDENCPMEHKNFFTVVPEIQIKGLTNLFQNGFMSGIKNIGSKALGLFTTDQSSTATNFTFDEYNLGRFALAITQIEMPDFLIPGANDESTTSIQTPRGHTKLMSDNSKPGLNMDTTKSISISFLEMATPIIESFIVPWMIALQKNTINQTDVTYKLNFVVKFYRADEIAGMEFLMNPTFIYRITGAYPISVDTINPTHGATDGKLNSRKVSFAFNNGMIFSNAQYEKLITGTGVQYFAYEDLSPVQILNKLNYQAGSVASIYNQAKNTF